MRAKFFLFLIFLAVTWSEPGYSASFIEKCAALLSGTTAPQAEASGKKDNKRTSSKATSGVIGYMSDLLEHQIIGDRELTRLMEGLNEGRLVNPIADEDAIISSALFIHRDGLEGLLRESDLDLERLKDWAKVALKNKAVVRVKRDQVRVETQDIHKKLEFGSIKADTFIQGEGNEVRETTLSSDFDLMSYDFTQRQASKLLGFNPSHFSNGP